MINCGKYWNRLHAGVRFGPIILWTGYRGGRWIGLEWTGARLIFFMGIPHKHHSVMISFNPNWFRPIIGWVALGLMVGYFAAHLLWAIIDGRIYLG